MPKDPTILIVGASARAAAASALRAGYSPWSADLFADADLARACPVVRSAFAKYPHGLFDAMPPNVPWLYTGGLENFPKLLDRPHLWGNGPDAVRSVRDPQTLARALADFPPPRIIKTLALPMSRSTPWLIKPRRGSGGLDVRFWNPGESIPSASYLQEFVDGEPASAVFAGSDGRSHFLGATRQLIGTSWLHALRPFQYAGTLGTLELPRQPIESLGQILVDRFGLRGLFGVDFIIAGERIRPIEVNPRYPASFEILERTAGRSLFDVHVAAFVPSASSLDVVEHKSKTKSTRVHGKAIYFAPQDLIMPPVGPWTAAFDFPLDAFDLPFADIPAAGSTIARGDPVLTMFAAADSVAGCEAALRKIATDLDRVFRHG